MNGLSVRVLTLERITPTAEPSMPRP